MAHLKKVFYESSSKAFDCSRRKLAYEPLYSSVKASGPNIAQLTLGLASESQRTWVFIPGMEELNLSIIEMLSLKSAVQHFKQYRSLKALL